MDELDAIMGDWEEDGQVNRLHAFAAAGQFIERRIARKKGRDCDDDLNLSDLLAYAIGTVIDDLNPAGLEITPEEEEVKGATA